MIVYSFYSGKTRLLHRIIVDNYAGCRISYHKHFHTVHPIDGMQAFMQQMSVCFASSDSYLVTDVDLNKLQ